MSIYYDYSKIDGYHCPVKIVVSRRGLGKTFGKVKYCIEKFVTKEEKFIYVVETGDMIKELARDNGAKFWNAIIEYYCEQDTSRKRYFYNKLTEKTIVEVDGETDEEVINSLTKLIGGTIKIDGKTAGYIVDFNSFAELKRNNFNGVKRIFVDEFISEKIDKTTLQYPRRLSSIIQSVARLRDIEIYMAGNTVRLDDPILSRMGFKIEKYGLYKRYINGKLFCVLDFVNPADYPEFAKKHDNSVAGRFSKMLGETHEEENKFLEDLPKSRRLTTFKWKKNGFLVNVIKDDVIVTIKEMEDGNFAVLPFANKNTSRLFCLTEKEQGYKFGYHIFCNSTLKQMILNMLRSDMLRYYSEVEYSQLKIIIQGGK